MKTLQDNRISLYSSLIGTGDLTARVAGADASASWCELAEGFVLNERLDDLIGCSVVLATVDQSASPLRLHWFSARRGRPSDCSLSSRPVARKPLHSSPLAPEADVIVTDQPGFESINSRGSDA